MQSIKSLSRYSIQVASQSTGYLGVNTASNVTLTTSPSDAVLFTITTSTHNSERWNICTNYPSGKFCLDQWGDNVTQVALQAAGYFSGQEWTLSGTQLSDATVWKMQSDFGGPTKYMAASGSNVVMISNAPDTAVNWKLVEVGGSSTSSSSATATSASTSAGSNVNVPSVNTGSASPPVTSSVNNSPVNFTSSLGTGAIVGIVLGAVAVILLAICAILLFRRRKSKSQVALQPALAPMKQDYSPNSTEYKPISQSYVAEIPNHGAMYQQAELDASPTAAPYYHEMDGGRGMHVHELGNGRDGRISR